MYTNLQDELNNRMVGGFDGLIGARVIKLTEGYSEVEIELTPEHLNGYGYLHGGLMYSLVDLAGGAAATTRSKLVPTINGNIQYLNPYNQMGKIVAKATEIKKGKRVLVYEVKVLDEKQVLLAQATMTYYRLDDKGTRK